MTENEYFEALRDVLHPVLKAQVNAQGCSYVIQEQEQKPFELNIIGINTHQAIKPDAITSTWPCFLAAHSYAQLRCDRVVVSWDASQGCPKYLLVELKSTNSGGAHKQLGATLALCHFIHQMVCVGQVAPPIARFAAVTVWKLPVAMKNTSAPKLPQWNIRPLQPDCKHMHYERSRGSIPVKAMLAAF